MAFHLIVLLFELILFLNIESDVFDSEDNLFILFSSINIKEETV